MTGVIITTSSVWFFWWALLWNRLPRTGMSPMPGIFDIVLVSVLFISPAIANVCPSRSSTSVSVRRVDSAGMRNPSMCDGVGEVERAHLGTNLQVHQVAAEHRRREAQTDAELLEHDRHGVGAVARLHHRVGILAAGEEARLLAVRRNQVRLGEALEQPLGLQRMHDAAETFLRVEDEQVEEVAEHQPLLGVEVGRRHCPPAPCGPTSPS